jgi:aminoacyl tRNA synthase complex-interacting multifunctional protein 1
MIQSPSVTTTTSSSTKEQIKGGWGEEKKVKEKTEKNGEEKEKPRSATASADSKPIGVSCLELRIACIVTAEEHPNADSLYVKEVDVGKAGSRTVISRLVNHVPLEQMQNQMVVFTL